MKNPKVGKLYKGKIFTNVIVKIMEIIEEKNIARGIVVETGKVYDYILDEFFNYYECV